MGGCRPAGVRVRDRHRLGLRLVRRGGQRPGRGGCHLSDGGWFEAIADHAGVAYLRYSFTKGTAQEVKFLAEVLALRPGERVLDVGCGPGRHAHALRALGVDVVGLDIAWSFLRVAGGGRWTRGDARHLPFPDSSFDAVISLCQGGFGLLGGAEDAKVVGEMARVVGERGRVALTAFSAYFAVRYLEDGDDFDAGTGVNHEVATVKNPAGEAADFDLWTTCFTPRELRLTMAGVGLSVEDLWSVGPGDYRRRPPDLEHPEWLVVARPAGAAPV